MSRLVILAESVFEISSEKEQKNGGDNPSHATAAGVSNRHGVSELCSYIALSVLWRQCCRLCVLLKTLDVSGDGMWPSPADLDVACQRRWPVGCATPSHPSARRRLNEQCINEPLEYRWSSSSSTATTTKGQFNLPSPVTRPTRRAAVGGAFRAPTARHAESTAWRPRATALWICRRVGAGNCSWSRRTRECPVNYLTTTVAEVSRIARQSLAAGALVLLHCSNHYCY